MSTKILKRIRFIGLLLIVILVSSLFLSMPAEAADDIVKTPTEYELVGTIEDDPETEIDEALIHTKVIAIFGEQPGQYWSMGFTHKCATQYMISDEGTRTTIYIPVGMIPYNAYSIMSNQGLVYYYYLEPTRIYTYPVEITVLGEKITGYFVANYSSGMFIEIKQPEQEVDPEESEKEEVEIPKPSNPLMDYIEKIEGQVRALYLIAIILSITCTFSTILALKALNKCRTVNSEQSNKTNQKKNH